MKKGIKNLAILFSVVFLLTMFIPAKSLICQDHADKIELISVTPPKGTILQRGTEVPFEVKVSYKLESQPSGFVVAGLRLLSGRGLVIGQEVDVSQGSGTVVISGLVYVEELYNWVEADTVYLEIMLVEYCISEEEVLDLKCLTEYPYYIEGEAPTENQPPVADVEEDPSVIEEEAPQEEQPPTTSFTVSDKWEKSVKVIPEGLLPGSEIGANVSSNWGKIDEQGRNVFQIYKIESWSSYFVGAYRISIESKSGTLWSKLIPATPLEMTYYPEQLYVHADDWISVKTYGITEKESLGLWSIVATWAGLPGLPPGDLPFFIGHNEDYLAPPNIDTSGFPSIAEEGEIYPLILGCFCSPGELRVYDTQGRVTGLINGEVMEEIPNSAYFKGIFVILSPNDSYRYEVVGTEEKEYKIGVVSAEAEEANAFVATDVPTSTNTVHQYTIDWNALSKGEKAVTMKIDSDGDGTSEKTFTADSELTHDEFVSKTAGLSFWIWIAGGVVITLILVISFILIKRRLARK